MLLLFDCMMNDFQKHFSFEWSNFLFGTYILWVVNCAGLGLINHLWKSHVICNYDEEWWCSVHNYNRVSCFLDGWKFFTQKRGGPRRDWNSIWSCTCWFCNHLEITAEDSFVSSDDLANLINYLQMQAYQEGTLQIWHNLLIRSDRIIGFLVWFASCTVFQLLTTTYKEDPVYWRGQRGLRLLTRLIKSNATRFCSWHEIDHEQFQHFFLVRACWLCLYRCSAA